MDTLRRIDRTESNHPAILSTLTDTTAHGSILRVPFLDLRAYAHLG